MQSRDNVPPVVQPPPQNPQNINVSQDIGINQIPAQSQRRNRAFQILKSEPFEMANNIG